MLKMLKVLKNSTVENIFLLMPFFISWGMVFNISGSKHLLSRLIGVICLYLVIFYRKDILKEISNNTINFFVVFLTSLAVYYSFLHYYNDGHFDFPRTVFACIFYALFLPRKFANKYYFSLLISASSIITILIALYDSFFLEIRRVGEVVNSGPYAYICAIMLIVQSYLFYVEFKLNKISKFSILYGLLSIGLLFVIYLTETRTAWLALFFIVIYFIFKTFCLENKKYGVSLVLITILFAVFAFFQPKVQSRLNTSLNDVRLIIGGNLTSSSGSRIDMWINGLKIGMESPFIGVKNQTEQDLVKQAFDNKEMQFVAYDILEHPRSSYHNVYIQSFVKGGAIALILMMVFTLLPVLLTSQSVLAPIAWPITIVTLICSMFESQFTIYSSVVYFYLLLIIYSLKLSVNKTGGLVFFDVNKSGDH